jgi:hypothetical protein
MLINAGLLRPEQVRKALQEQERWGGPLGMVMVAEGMITEELLVKALSQQLNIPIVPLKSMTIDPEVLRTVSFDLCEQHGLIGFRVQSKFLDVAMSDPMNMGILDELRIRTQLNVRPHLATPTEIREAIARSYGRKGRHRDVSIEFDNSIHRQGDSKADVRDAEIAALQKRIAVLEGLVVRDEDVLRKLMGLLVKKGVATREEILEAIHQP